VPTPDRLNVSREMQTRVGTALLAALVGAAIGIAGYAIGHHEAPVKPAASAPAAATQPVGLLIWLHGCPAGYKFYGSVAGPVDGYDNTQSTFSVCGLP
jgi:hypothetical protein